MHKTGPELDTSVHASMIFLNLKVSYELIISQSMIFLNLKMSYELIIS